MRVSKGEGGRRGDESAQASTMLHNIKQFRRKQFEMKSKGHQMDKNSIQSTTNFINYKNTQELHNGYPEIRQICDKNQQLNDDQKLLRQSVRFPVINPRKSHKGMEPRIQQREAETEEDRQNRLSSHSKNSEDQQKITSFLKFMQIKPMKPTEKTLIQKNNMSVRQLKITRQEKSIPSKLNKINTQHFSPTDSGKKLQPRVKLMRNEERCEKSITIYSAKKEKKSMSFNSNIELHKKKSKSLTNTYFDFCNFLCLLNKVKRPGSPIATYKAFIGKGNNSILIKNCLKSRFWWNIVDGENEVNLNWTQSRDQKFIDLLKCSSSETEPNTTEQSKMVVNAEFVLPRESKEMEKGNQLIQEHTGSGFDKLLSQQQKKQYTKNSHKVQIKNLQLCSQLGSPNKSHIHNHLEFNWHICNKKALYYNLKKYYHSIGQDPFAYIPLTFHIQEMGDQEWLSFVATFEERAETLQRRGEQKDKYGKKKKEKEKNVWIVKPGENSNQGNGIQVFETLDEIREMVKNSGRMPNGRQHSYIVQRYLMPFLYNRRKFDIRCYVLVTCVRGIYKAYWYEEGYIRTSCKQFTIKNLKNRFIHLTNDAVQKKSEEYGKFENGNKISFVDFQKYLTNTFPEKDYKFYKTVYPTMIKVAADAIKSTCMLMDSKRRDFTFEIFGLDFMIDEDFVTWLIEVNTNPCLELCSPLLARVIPNMVENALKIAVDPLFPPPKQIPKTKTLPTDLFQSNKFTLIFNSSEDQELLTNLIKDTNLQFIVKEDEEDEKHDDVE